MAAPLPIIDLTLPVRPHFRWQVERRQKGDLDAGDAFQVTWVGLTVHGFTHVDAPRHMVPGGKTTSDTPLEQLVGEAAVLDLSDARPCEAIDESRLATAAGSLKDNDIALLNTSWDRQRSIDTREFWTEAPYLTRSACEWLRRRKVRAVGFDFPQDYPIRGLLDGVTAPMEEFVSHDILLRNDVILIEYLCNLSAIPGKRVMFAALPLKLPDSDGAPARAVAWEHSP